MAKCNLELSDNERYLLLLGMVRYFLDHGAPVGFDTSEPPATPSSLIYRLVKLKNTLEHPAFTEKPALVPVGDGRKASERGEHSLNTGTPLGLSPPSDKFVPADAVRELTIFVHEISKYPNRLVVKMKDANGGIAPASCWDPKLFPRILEKIKRDVTFLVKETTKGRVTYLNIVGLK